MEAKEGEAYPPSINYMENSLGCSFKGLSDRFEGEMNAVYFVRISKDEVEKFHKVLQEVGGFLEMEDLLAFALTGEAKRRMFSQLEEAFDFSVLKQLNLPSRTFLQANPKYTDSIVEGHKNPVREVCGYTKIYKSIPVRSAIENMGGINCFLPFLNYLIGVDRELRLSFLKKLFEMMKDFLVSNIQLMEFFMGSNNSGLTVLYYLLKQLAIDSPLEIEVLDAFESLLPVIKKQYYSFFNKYLLIICYNNCLWKYSDHATQTKIIERMSTAFNPNNTSPTEFYIDVLMSFIGAKDNNEPTNNTLKELILKLYSNNISIEFTDTLFNYAYGYYSRQDTYTTQVYHILYIFVRCFNACKCCGD